MSRGYASLWIENRGSWQSQSLDMKRIYSSSLAHEMDASGSW